MPGLILHTGGTVLWTKPDPLKLRLGASYVYTADSLSFFFFFGLPPSPFLQRVSPSEAQTMANPLVTLTAWYPVALVVAGMVCEIPPLVPGSHPFRPPQSSLVDNSDRFEAVGVTNVVIGDKDMLRFE